MIRRAKYLTIGIITEIRASRDIFVTTSTTKKNEGGEPFASTFSSSLSFRAERQRINLRCDLSSVAARLKYAHACITHEPGRELHHAHESLYVAQGCSSSGSLLCVVFVASPAGTHIHIGSLSDPSRNTYTIISTLSTRFQWARHNNAIWIPSIITLLSFTMYPVERQISSNNVQTSLLPLTVKRQRLGYLKELLQEYFSK